MARKPFVVGTSPDATDLKTFAQTVGQMFAQVQRGVPKGPSTQTITRTFTIPEGLLSEHVLYRCDASLAAFTITLPKSQTSLDTSFTLKRVNAGGNVVTWQTQGTDTVDGATTGTLATQYATLRLHCRSGGFDVT